MATQVHQVPDVPVLPPAPVPELDQTMLVLVLEWIGFVDAGQRTCITDDAFQKFSDVFAMNEKDVNELNTSFSRWTAANGKIDFGIRLTKKLTYFLHRVNNAACILYTPSTTWYVQAYLLAALSDAGERADIQR